MESKPAVPQPQPSVQPQPVTTSQPIIQSAPPLKLENLKGKIPDSVISQISFLNKDINSPLRLAHFLAQASHESANFKIVYENLNYSIDGLIKTFPKYFPENLAISYARFPEKIGSRVYANRMGNGNEASGDGWKFRGRGYIQLTGKTNYINFTKFIGKDCVANPDLVATDYPLASAAFFFNSNNIWVICDKGSDDDTVTAVTKVINGGTIGLPDRIEKFRYFNQLLS